MMRTIIVFPDSTWRTEYDVESNIRHIRAKIDDKLTDKQIDMFVKEYLLELFGDY